tara:strand:+ start:1229 stop:1612 length:384 start_codon:yes stop_codon:yes gene_type:complete
MIDNIFDFYEAKRRKEEGMDRAAQAKKELLQHARDIAVWYAKNEGNGYCCSDDVAMVMQKLELDYSELGMAAGSIFKSKEWEYSGFNRKTKRVVAHAREIKIWRLVDHNPLDPLDQTISDILKKTKQ